jgi:hypothetical protein
VKVIAGGANNQLSTPDMGEKVKERGILYAPDYVINGGGIINVAAEISGTYDMAWVDGKVTAPGADAGRGARPGPARARRRTGWRTPSLAQNWALILLARAAQDTSECLSRRLNLRDGWVMSLLCCNAAKPAAGTHGVGLAAGVVTPLFHTRRTCRERLGCSGVGRRMVLGLRGLQCLKSLSRSAQRRAGILPCSRTRLDAFAKWAAEAGLSTESGDAPDIMMMTEHAGGEMRRKLVFQDRDHAARFLVFWRVERQRGRGYEASALSA